MTRMVFEQYHARIYSELYDTRWKSFLSEYASSQWSLENEGDSQWRLEIYFSSKKSLHDTSSSSPLPLVGRGFEEGSHKGTSAE